MRAGDEYISQNTFRLLTVGLTLLFLIALVGLTATQYLPVEDGPAALGLATDVGSVVFGVLAATVLYLVSRRFQPGNPLRRIWLLLGIGIAAYAIGDIIWTVLDIRSGFGEVPYPSIADALYVAMYFFLGAGIIRTAGAFGRVADVRKPLMAGLALTVVALMATYAFVVGPVLTDTTTPLAQKALGAVYPISDIVVLLGPAVFIVLAARTIGSSRDQRQWRVLAIGLGVMSLSDVAFTLLDWTGTYVSGHPVDFGWMLSLLLIALAGSLSADAIRGQKARSSPEGEQVD